MTFLTFVEDLDNLRSLITRLFAFNERYQWIYMSDETYKETV